MARRCSRLFVSAARASVLCLPMGECSLPVHSYQLPPEPSTGAALPWDQSMGCCLSILAASPVVLSEAQRIGMEVQACPDGMWPWDKSPDKHASEDTDLKGDGKEPLVILTFHLTCDSFAFPHPTVCQALAFVGIAWIEALSFCPNWGGQMENEGGSWAFLPSGG